MLAQPEEIKQILHAKPFSCTYSWVVSWITREVALAFIDANYDTDELIKDLNYAWDRLLPGGYIFGDDVNEPNVFNAFQIFAREKDIELTLYSKCARIQKTEKVNPNLRYYAPPESPVSRDILIVNFKDHTC